MNSIDQEAANILGSQQSNNSSSSSIDDVANQILSSQQINSPNISAFQGIDQDELATSKESFANPGERLLLSLGNPEGIEQYLKKKYAIVKRVGNDNFLAGDSVNTLRPLDRNGFLNDVIGDMAELVPTATNIGASVLGGMFGGVPGATAAGAGVEAIGKGISKASGINTQDPIEVGTDVLISGFGSGAAEGFSQFLKKLPNTEMAKKGFSAISKFLSRSGTPPEQSRAAQAIAKIFSVTSATPEDKILNVFKYGPEEVFKKENGTNEALLKIIDDFSGAIKSNEQYHGNLLGEATNKLVSKTSGYKINTAALQDSTIKSMRELGIINDAGIIDKNVISGSREKNILKKTLQKLGANVDDSVSVNPKAQVDIKELLNIDRQLRIAKDGLSRQPNSQRIIGDLIHGEINSGKVGIMDEVAELAKKSGNTDFLAKRTAYREFKDSLDNLTKYGLNPLNNKVSIENVTKGASEMSAVLRRELDKLQGLMKEGDRSFIKRMDIWDTAQEFKKMNPSIIRFNTIASIMGIGGFALGDSPQEKAAGAISGLLGASLIGTPYGVGKMLKYAPGISRIGAKGMASKSIPKQVGRSTSQSVRTGAQVLGQLIKSRAKSDSK